MPPHHASRRLPHLILLRCVVLAATFAVAAQPALRSAAAAPTARAFDLPADTGDKSLSRFALQAGVEVIFGSATAAQIRTNTVKGTFLPREALDLLLAHTGLVATQDETTGALTVARDPKAPGVGPKAASSDHPGPDETRATPSQAAVPSPSGDGNIVELNPFVVTSDKETGYLATNTLAGTRLNTDLKDVGAAVSVYTEEFLADIGVQRIEDILTYTASTEGGGVNGNYTGIVGDATDDFRDNPSGVNRVRALASATRTRDYFPTDLPADTYNFGALTVSRGPNAVLAGIGNAGGIIDSSMRKAVFKDSNQVVTRIGSFGTHREEVHLNKVLLNNRLAIRADLLYEDRRYRQDPTFEKDQRAYFAATLKLREPKRGEFLGRTTVRANYETGAIEGVPPDPLSPPISIQYWFDNQNPAYNKWYFNGATQALYDGNNNLVATPALSGIVVGFPLYRNWNLVYADPNTTRASVGFAGPDLASIQGFIGTIPTGAQGPGGSLRSTGDKNRAKAGYLRTRIMDRNNFDYFNHLLTGAFDHREQDFDALDLRMEQLLMGGKAGFELAYNNQSFERRRDLPFGSSGNIFIDTNKFLSVRTTAYPNGIPNPNFGRPFIISSDVFRDQVNRSDRESFQATAFVQHDFTQRDSRLAGWLGRHTLSGLAFKTKIATGNRTYGSTWDPAGQLNPINSLAQPPGSFGAQVNAWFYLGDSAANLNRLSELRLQPLRGALPEFGETYTIRTYDTVAKSFQTGTSKPLRILKLLRDQEENVTSQAITLQSHWLKDHLTTLVGWRKDESDAYTSADLPPLPTGDVDRSKYQMLPASSQGQDSWTKSVVVKYPEKLLGALPFGADLRAYWNGSENFNPVGQRRNVWNEELGSPSAKTKEFGVMLSLFKGRLDLRVNRYETKIKDDSIAGIGNPYEFINTTILRMVGAYHLGLAPADYGFVHSSLRTFEDVARAFYATVPERLAKNMGSDKNFDPKFVGAGSSFAWEQDSITNRASISDTVSKGMEYELIWNLTPSWRLAVNVAKNEAVKANVAREELAFVNQWIENLKTQYGGTLARGWVLPPTQSNSVLSFYQAETVPGIQTANKLSGSSAPEIRKWRANAVTRYEFRRGFLKGASLGGTMRWQGKIGIGYPYILDASGQSVADLANPYMGPEEMQIDLSLGYRRQFPLLGKNFNWTIGLNVYNVNATDEIIPIASNADGTYGTFRIPPNRVWSLSNSFTF